MTETYVIYQYMRVPEKFREEILETLRAKHLKKKEPPASWLFPYSPGRGWAFDLPGFDKVWPCGGLVLCTIKNKETNETMGIGKAKCSLSDNFVYKVGRKIAFQRAQYDMEQMGGLSYEHYHDKEQNE